MTSLLRLALALPLLVPGSAAPQDETPPAAASGEMPEEAFETVTRKMRDGVVMTADHFRAADFMEAEDARPWGVVVALHQDQASRGEYRPIGPELAKLGLDVLAVDLRAGKRRFRVENETAKSFEEEIGGDVGPADCLDDLDFAVRWARQLVPTGPLILFGSKSGAALALVYAAREDGVVDAVFCFSPGEYVRGTTVQEEAGKLRIPVYATCGPGTKELTFARVAVDLIDKAYVTTYFPDRGTPSLPGVQTLLAGSPEDRTRQWDAVKRVLEEVRGKR